MWDGLWCHVVHATRAACGLGNVICEKRAVPSASLKVCEDQYLHVLSDFLAKIWGAVTPKPPGTKQLKPQQA
jgi:hypothetical protein